MFSFSLKNKKNLTLNTKTILRFMRLINFLLYIDEIPLGVWLLNAEYNIVDNQKKGQNLLFNGYLYNKEARFSTQTNWVCVRGTGSSKRAINEGGKCLARCVTRKDDGALKLGRHKHCHKS